MNKAKCLFSVSATALFLALSSCATSYKGAVGDVTYVGQNTYVVSAGGNTYTRSDKIRGYLVRAAYETCKSRHESGFIAGDLNQGLRYGSADFGNGPVLVSKPNGSFSFKCEGPVDPVFSFVDN